MGEGTADIALIGLARLGQSLALALSDHGYRLVTYNRTTKRVDEFIRGKAAGRTVVGAHSLDEAIGCVARPRKVILTVTAGAPVDTLIEQLLPRLDPGDVIVDAGNSLFTDTARRAGLLEERGLLLVGAGVSGTDQRGGGPSLMLGGSPEAWPVVREMFQSIAGSSPDGVPCCGWVGEGGAGHFVKLTHNAIEYADMQLICDAYQLLRAGLGFAPDELRDVFVAWNRGELDSYLLAVTEDIVGFRDGDGTPLLERVLDTADQKGTGRWAVTGSLELGVPMTLLTEAVHARSVSAMRADREVAAELFGGPSTTFDGDPDGFVEDIRQALVASRIVSYAQAHLLLRAAAEAYRWSLDYSAVAAAWQGGCIIRSAILDDAMEAVSLRPDLRSLLLDARFRDVIDRCGPSWRRVVATAARLGIPVPAISAALTYFDGYRSARLPANLLQAQRDQFGGHGYERLDRPRGQAFHTDWSGSAAS